MNVNTSRQAKKLSPCGTRAAPTNRMARLPQLMAKVPSSLVWLLFPQLHLWMVSAKGTEPGLLQHTVVIQLHVSPT